MVAKKSTVKKAKPYYVFVTVDENKPEHKAFASLAEATKFYEKVSLQAQRHHGSVYIQLLELIDGKKWKTLEQHQLAYISWRD